MRNLVKPISKLNRNKNCFLFSQSKNKLEDITFYNEICGESLDAGFLRSLTMHVRLALK